MRTSSSLLLLAAAMAATLFCAAEADPYPTGPWTPYRDYSGALWALGQWAVKETYNPLLHFEGVESGRYHDRGNNRVDWEIIVIASPRAGDKEKYRALVIADNFMTPIDLIAFEHYRSHSP